jgi:hypothetical protein
VGDADRCPVQDGNRVALSITEEQPLKGGSGGFGLDTSSEVRLAAAKIQARFD